MLYIISFIMGQQSTDCYKTEELQLNTRYDRPPPSYIWMDAKMQGSENKLYMARFKERFQVDGQDSFEILKPQIETWGSADKKLRLICAASLKDEEFNYIQNNDKVERVLLFCGNKIRASNLMRDFAKIKKACFAYTQVIRVVKSWENQNLTSVLFFQLQQVQKINKLNANIKALSDTSFQAKQLYKDYFLKFLKKEDLPLFESMEKEYSALRSNPQVSNEHAATFFKKHFLNASPLIEEANFLLKATSSPKKLANLRYLISDLFNTIRTAYRQYKIKADTFSSVVCFNEQELSRIKTSVNAFIIFTHFVEAAPVAPSSQAELREFELIVEITVPSKNPLSQGCNGYITSPKSVLFNLGNYFQITKYSQQDKKLSLRLINVEQMEVSLNKKESWLLLNRSWVNAQHKLYEGQYYSLLLHDQAAAEEYLSDKISAASKQKQKQTEAIFSWNINRQKWRIKAGKPEKQIQDKIQALLASSSGIGKVLANVALCELFWSRKKEEKLRWAIKRLAGVKQKDCKEQVSIKIQLFRLYDRFLSEKARREEVLWEIKKYEQIMNKAANYLASQNYHLFLAISISCLQMLGSYEEELEVITKLSLIYSITQGANSHSVTEINKQKIEVMNLKDEKVSQKERERKAKLYTSSVKLEDLKEEYEGYQIEISQLKMQLYD